MWLWMQANPTVRHPEPIPSYIDDGQRIYIYIPCPSIVVSVCQKPVQGYSSASRQFSIYTSEIIGKGNRQKVENYMSSSPTIHPFSLTVTDNVSESGFFFPPPSSLSMPMLDTLDTDTLTHHGRCHRHSQDDADGSNSLSPYIAIAIHQNNSRSR